MNIELEKKINNLVDIYRRNMSYTLVLSVIYLIFSLNNLSLPGLYYDAVNPDYIAAKYLTGIDPYINHFPPYTTFPTLGQLYHGVGHFYLSSVFFNIFGTSDISLRLMHSLLGLIIVLLSFILLKRLIGNNHVAFAVCAVLAVDPTLTFAFRTQSYITLTPIIFTFISILLLLNTKTNTILKLIISGFSSGLAFYGYFVYLFFIPAFIILIINKQSNYKQNTKNIVIWSSGFCIGCILYIIGYIQFINELGSFTAFIESLKSVSMSNSSYSLFHVITAQFNKLLSAISGEYNYLMMFSASPKLPLGQIKVGLIVSIILWSISKNTTTKTNSIPLNFIFSFLLISFIFGNKIGSHHLVIILPFLYLQLGISIIRILEQKKNISAYTTLCIVGLICISLNFSFQFNTQKTLNETGGVGYYSDSLKQLALEALHSNTNRIYVFGEWGFSAPFAILTEGKILYKTSIDYYDLSKTNCDFNLVFIHWNEKNEHVEKAAYDFSDNVKKKHYYQRNGEISFTTLTTNRLKVCK